jgi:hypothetical protein
MSADVCAVQAREGDRRAHRGLIACVSTAGNIDGRQERNEPLIVPEALAHVAIEIDRMCTIAKHPCNFSLIPVSLLRRQSPNFQRNPAAQPLP